MDAKGERQIASVGGKVVPDDKRSFCQNAPLAAEARRKGGDGRTEDSRADAGLPPAVIQSQ
jgi:hypothetical protein